MFGLLRMGVLAAQHISFFARLRARHSGYRTHAHGQRPRTDCTASDASIGHLLQRSAWIRGVWSCQSKQNTLVDVDTASFGESHGSQHAAHVNTAHSSTVVKCEACADNPQPGNQTARNSTCLGASISRHFDLHPDKRRSWTNIIDTDSR